MQAARAVVERAAHGSSEHTYGVNTGFGRFVSKRSQKSRPRSCSCACCGRTPAASAIPIPTRWCGRRCCCARTRSRRATPARGSRRSSCCSRASTAASLPRVPARGSVGASGDLAPLAHLALPLVGEGAAWRDGRLLEGEAALRRAGLEPVQLVAKEGLSLINGTQFMAAQGALGLVRARRLARAADCACALSLEALQGSRNSFLPQIQALRPLTRAGRRRRQRAAAARGLGDHRVAPLVRQGAGRVLAPLRAAGARRLPRPARLRRVHGRHRAERRDGQSARARRGGICSSPRATSTASRSRSRSMRWRWPWRSWRASRSAASSGSSTRT